MQAYSFEMAKEAANKNWEGFPCHWCGVMTVHLDAEHFHVCEFCTRDARKLSYREMCVKYPNHGKDERNPEYFANFREVHAVSLRGLLL